MSNCKRLTLTAILSLCCFCNVFSAAVEVIVNSDVNFDGATCSGSSCKADEVRSCVNLKEEVAALSKSLAETKVLLKQAHQQLHQYFNNESNFQVYSGCLSDER